MQKRSQCFLVSGQSRSIKDLTVILDVERKAFEQWFEWWNFEYINSLSISYVRRDKTIFF